MIANEITLHHKWPDDTDILNSFRSRNDFHPYRIVGYKRPQNDKHKTIQTRKLIWNIQIRIKRLFLVWCCRVVITTEISSTQNRITNALICICIRWICIRPRYLSIISRSTMKLRTGRDLYFHMGNQWKFEVLYNETHKKIIYQHWMQLNTWILKISINNYSLQEI